MLLVRIDLRKGKSDAYRQQIGRVVYEALLSVGVPKEGLSEILCAGPGFHQVLTKRSPNMMANWVLASAHSRGGIFHC